MQGVDISWDEPQMLEERIISLRPQRCPHVLCADCAMSHAGSRRSRRIDQEIVTAERATRIIDLHVNNSA